MTNRFSCVLSVWCVATILSSSIVVSAQPFPFEEDFLSELAQEVEASTSILWSDYDEDGHIDVLVGNAFVLDDFYHNEGNGNYTLGRIQAIPYESINSGTWADLNNDGLIDLIVTSLVGNALLVNTGFGGSPFAHLPMPIDGVSNVRDAIVADFDEDGMLDVVLIRRSHLANQYYIGTASGLVFDAENAVSQDFDDSTSGCWADVDNDGFFELYVTNSTGEANRFYDNQGGVLSAISLPPITSNTDLAGGCNWADYDNDGDFDLFVAGSPTSSLFENQGSGFVDVSQKAVGSLVSNSQGSAWGDVDNDGDLDLMVAKRDNQNVLFVNAGDGTFDPILFGDADDGWSSVATLVDDDEDGDLDYFIANGNSNFNQRNQLFRNTTNGENNWLEIDLESTNVGGQGIGARVYAYATVGGQPMVQMREVHTRTGRLAQGPTRIHFGFGDAVEVDSLMVDWPISGSQMVHDIAINTIIRVTEPPPTSTAPEEVLPLIRHVRVYPNPSGGSVTLELDGMNRGTVNLEVFDLIGRRIRAIQGEVISSGALRLVWDGLDESGEKVASGAYLLCVESGDWKRTVPVIVRR